MWVTPPFPLPLNPPLEYGFIVLLRTKYYCVIYRALNEKSIACVLGLRERNYANSGGIGSNLRQIPFTAWKASYKITRGDIGTTSINAFNTSLNLAAIT